MFFAIVSSGNIICLDIDLVFDFCTCNCKCSILQCNTVITIICRILLKLVANLLEDVAAGTRCFLAACKLPCGFISTYPAIFRCYNKLRIKLVTCMSLTIVLPCAIAGLNSYVTLLNGKSTRFSINSELISYIIVLIICYLCCALSLYYTAFIDMCSGLLGCQSGNGICIAVDYYRDAAIAVFIFNKSTYCMLSTIVCECTAVNCKVNGKCSVSAFSSL